MKDYVIDTIIESYNEARNLKDPLRRIEARIELLFILVLDREVDVLDVEDAKECERTESEDCTCGECNVN